MSTSDEPDGQLADQVAELAQARGLTVGVAESLTGGRIAVGLAAAQDASEWFRGSLVAYAAQVKFDLLGVRPGPVATAECAEQMVLGAQRLLGCEVAVAATGVGGPGPDDGVAAGTVFIACGRLDRPVIVAEHHLEGEPEDVVDQSVVLALRALQTVMGS